MFITITGNLGSGKSSVGTVLAEKLNYKFFSVGTLMRELATEKGISIHEIQTQAEQSDEIDILLDARQVALGKKHKDLIFDSRLGWHFIPDSIKIFLKVDIDEATKRIFNANRDSEKENNSLEETKANIISRRASEIKRYKEYYDLDHTLEENYDLVVNTTNISIEEAAKQILNFIDEK